MKADSIVEEVTEFTLSLSKGCRRVYPEPVEGLYPEFYPELVEGLVEARWLSLSKPGAEKGKSVNESIYESIYVPFDRLRERGPLIFSLNCVLTFALSCTLSSSKGDRRVIEGLSKPGG